MMIINGTKYNQDSNLTIPDLLYCSLSNARNSRIVKFESFRCSSIEKFFT